jgi:hypothetical protein
MDLIRIDASIIICKNLNENKQIERERAVYCCLFLYASTPDECMMGEIETEKVPRKCPKCGGDMKETGTVIMID